MHEQSDRALVAAYAQSGHQQEIILPIVGRSDLDVDVLVGLELVAPDGQETADLEHDG